MISTKRTWLILEEIDRIKASGTLIIVEGKNDKKALASLGITNVITLDRPLHEIVDLVCASNPETAILTDLDIEGKHLYHQLSTQLIGHGVRIDNRLRHALFSHTPVRQIEGLARWMAKTTTY